jgi:hypothetical protein
MKYILITIILIFPIIVFSQDFRSEIIQYKSYNQLKDDKLIRTDSVILQINERIGDYDAEIFIPYSKGDKVSIGEAWIEDMSGNVVRKLKSKDINDRSSISDISLYEDDFVKSFELKHNSYPYRIVYSFKITYSHFLSAVAINYTNSRKPVREGTVIVETDQLVKYKQENIDEPTVSTNAKSTLYKWRYSYKPQKTIEINSSPNTAKAPIIHVVPLNFKLGVQGSYESWETFGNWIFRLNKGKDILPVNEQIKIDKLLSGVNDDRTKAQILYQYLQDYTRYINISVNIGGFQTYPAEYVCMNRYGDCKALTNYMQAMLKYIGIKSYYTLIMAGNKVIDTDLDFPSQVFNHVILTVPFGKDTVYLECTSKNDPFGYMGTFTQGRKAVLVDEGNSHIINIPALTPEEVLCSRTFDVDLSNSIVKLKARERGYSYEQSNYLASEVNKNTVDKYIRNNIFNGSYDLMDFKFEKESRDNASINLTADCIMRNLHKEYGNNIIISPFPIDIPSYESPQVRTQDVQLDYPEYYKDTITYSVAGKTISKIPDSISMESAYGKYSIKYEVNDNKLYMYKSILIFSGRYSLDEYSEFYNFMVMIKNNENKKIYIE